MKAIAELARMYFIAVVLPAHIDEQVRVLKLWMNQTYGSKVGLKSPAHITIAPPFWMEESKEINLREDLETLTVFILPFSLATKNFSAFRPRTIFIAVEPSAELNALKKASDDFFRHKAYGVKMENRPFRPHITIATRDLHKKDFAEAWKHFENRDFRQSFKATGLSLLKHNGSKWDVVFTAAFGQKEC